MREVGAELEQMRLRVDEMERDISKKVQACALVKDVRYLQEQVEKKAGVEEMNEALQQKANKQSVANALHRKANRTDLDTLLESKADASDLDKLLTLLESKADHGLVESLATSVKDLPTRADLASLQQSCRGDLDIYVRAVQSQRVEQEERQKALEMEFDQVVETVKREVEGIRQSCMVAIGKKAEYAALEGLRAEVQKKVDHEYLGNTALKIKNECQTLM